MKSSSGLDGAQALDASDPLALVRHEFNLPRLADGAPSVYLCGHSLGLAPKHAATLVGEELAAWSRFGVEGHFESARPWVSYPEQLTDSLARLTGAAPLEVVAMNSLTVNLHLLLISFYRPTPQRPLLMIEKSAFPSDRYAVQSQIRQRGFDPANALLELAPRASEICLRTEDIIACIDAQGERIATVLLPGVQYLTGQMLDMQAIAAAARRHGCNVGFDLAHAIGNVPLRLHDWDVDFAVWCSYKYLNGGPGAIGGAFVHERHAHSASLPRFSGWWGHDKASRFAMPEQFQPLPGAEGWQVSNPPILAAAPLLASLQVFDRAGFAALRNKSIQLTQYLERLVCEELSESVDIITPREPSARGCQLSLRVHRSPEQARAIHRTLVQRGCICDWREPDVIRVAPVPLYNTFEHVWTFVAELKKVVG